MKKCRKTLESLNSQPVGVDGDKAKIDQLDILIKAIKAEIVVLDPLITEKKGEMETAEKSLKTSYGSMSTIFDERKTMQTELDQLKEAKSACYQTNKTLQDVWFTYEREQKQRVYDAEKGLRAEEREARLVAAAERELEDANIKAYATEIALCDALIKYFMTYSPGYVSELAGVPIAAVVETGIRTVEAVVPDRATVLLRKEDRDDDFLVLGNKKNKNKNRQKNSKPLKMDLEMIDQLAKLSIEIPKSTAEASGTIRALEEKRKIFLDTSVEQTAQNLKAVHDKIEKLRNTVEA